MNAYFHFHIRRRRTLRALQAPFRRNFSGHSWRSIPEHALVMCPAPPPPSYSQQLCPSTQPHPIPTQNFSQTNFSIISSFLRNPNISSGSDLHSELNRTGIEPDSGLVQAVFEHFDSSPKLLHTLFLWAETKPGFKSSVTLFNSMINVLAKAREFDSAWCMVLDKIGEDDGSGFVSKETFAVLIRRYARAGMPQAAIRTFEFGSNLDLINNSDSATSFFEILLDSLCKEGHVKVASEYVYQKKKLDTGWVPSIRIYNVLLNGWFRSRRLKHAERLWLGMQKENVKPSVVTYGTLVEGYCQMRRVERAIELVKEMRSQGIEPNPIVYNPIIDGLAEARRFDEALGMMERFLICEEGPTMSTYNSLVKGYCKAGDLAGASKILKMMINRGFVPSPTTYNYFFRYFTKFRKIEEAMNLYTKMISTGYIPDRLTYHLLLKMLCEEERLDLAVQINKEMKSRGYDADLATSTMLIHLLLKMYKFEEAFAEFEDMIRRGTIPQYLTFQRMNDEFKRRGMSDMVQKLCNLMSSVPYSTGLPNTYSEDRNASRAAALARRTSIMRRAEAMSDLLKTCRDPREIVKHRSSLETAVSSANQLMDDMKKRLKLM
ncbi:pentatricopeptide repeat-containing protein At5g11310, mitochondrial-like [Mangifera indica]|uniref:pentatricopeptide repeat-containing protein At5g11310, mitochondrial-like n=1 Tax=Mangifera indica TaxID=29780 RepID=UPI001CFA1762|nr:pentatricopeptide repeat-containing protein At5g11310, mitochondrial-like [Mangifera indica]XP_044464612.1 pentatricopeptide repeat-containing protein At5g11310, mitochondrial-like [Mangifera indica]XP_044464613.1 pentatricopeptide repeat-containing protein At5g11310, mitochondrial-like [Mangifera indica]